MMKALGYTKDQAPGAISPYLPDFIADDIADVDFVRLKELGVTHLMLDLDGTLRKAYSKRLESEVIEVFREIQDQKLFKVIAIASNNNFRLQKFARPIGAQVFQPFWRNTRLIRKPHPLFFSQVMGELGIKPAQAVMIGDRLRSDIVGANRAGIRTVLIKQRGSGYWFDRILLSGLRERRHYERALSARRLHLPSTIHYLRDALASAHLPSEHIERVANNATRSTSYIALNSKRTVFIKLVSHQHTLADKVYKTWRRLTFRPLQGNLEYENPARVLEHERKISKRAIAAGVSVPKILQLIDMGDRRFALVSEYIDGATLDHLPKASVTDRLLGSIWKQAALLQKAHIAHGDLRASNIMVKKSKVWFFDFDAAPNKPTSLQLRKDIVELLVSTACIVGAERAAKSASKYIAHKRVDLLPYINRDNLSSFTRHKANDQLLSELKAEIKAAA